MRNEILEAEKAGPASAVYSFDVRINLGVAFMQLGNQSPGPFLMYNESENMFLSVLKVHPEYEPANRNLAAVRRNKRIRAGIEMDDDSKEASQQVKKKPKVHSVSRAKPSWGESIDTLIRSASTTCTDSKHAERFLTIGIPTVPRAGGQRYLTQTLSAIMHQLPTRPDNPFFKAILVLVLNNRPGMHTEFEDLKKQLQHSQYSHYFSFQEVEVDEDAIPHDPRRVWRHEQAKVRLHTLNFTQRV